ncbi:MAG: WecB/TagA/CpsF family glycosyltransferase [candidate division FCPU426 bacterium]
MPLTGASGAGCQSIYTVSALTLLEAYEDPDYAEVLNRADLLTADGAGAVWAIRRLTGVKAARLPGVDLLFDLAGVCAAEGQGVFLLGGKPGVAERAGKKLQERFPGLKICGCADGFWQAEDEAALIARINQAQPGLLVVGLGQPAQERFIDRHHRELAVRVALGVGGGLDVAAGDLKRAPLWMRRAGLEWLYRTWQEPWRLRRLGRLPKFIWKVWRTPRVRPDAKDTRHA